MNLIRKLVFIGCMNTEFDTNAANSPAANQVQLEIIQSIKSCFVNFSLISAMNHPKRTWPYSNLIQKGQVGNGFKYQGYLNIIFLRDLIIYFRHFILISRLRPAIIFKYNINFFESVFLYTAKLIFNTKVVVFIQDVSFQTNEAPFIRKYFEKIAFKITSYFDVIVPITKDIQADFNFKKENCFVFQGGVTSQSRSIILSEINFEKVSKSKYVVFAGALEEYNGIKSIVEYWEKNIIEFDLYVYGKGTCENFVVNAAARVSNIKYFGFVPESEIIAAQISSFGNFCLRYSNGIDQKYFFPSKLYNVLACPGKCILNEFLNIPDAIKNSCCILDENSENLKFMLETGFTQMDINNYYSRIDWLCLNANWSLAIENIKEILNKLD